MVIDISVDIVIAFVIVLEESPPPGELAFNIVCFFSTYGLTSWRWSV